jgi:hypothetical protein
MSQTMSQQAKNQRSSLPPATKLYTDLASAEDRAFAKGQQIARENPNLTDKERLAKRFP